MKHLLRTFVLVLFAVWIISTVRIFAADEQIKPVADVMIGSSGITWLPKVSYQQMQVSLARPDGTFFQKTFSAGSTPYIDMSGIFGTGYSEGTYTYELRITTAIKAEHRGEIENAGLLKNPISPEEAMTQSGTFTVLGGSIISGTNEEISRTMDVVHADDVIITGSQCIGFDCAIDGSESFGLDTIRLKENSLRIHFDDTSTSAGFPANDWRIVANDSSSGGANYMAFEDTTGSKTPFKVTAGARSNAIFVSSTSRVGFGTSTPVVDLQMVNGNTPTMRLDQDGSSGWSPQAWDVAGNETNFFIRDVTGGSKLPFRIEPGTPTNTLTMGADGYVGIGTWTPGYPLELVVTGDNATFGLQRTDGAIAKIAAGTNAAQFGSDSNHSVKIMVNNSTTAMTINTSGQVGIGITPTHLLHLSGGAYSDGATWQPACSRMFKENIKGLTLDEAKTALEGLSPVKFNYKSNKEEDYIGFIAEDVPELVATKERKSINTMDVVAVLTKIVQEQQKTISRLEQRVAELEKK